MVDFLYHNLSFRVDNQPAKPCIYSERSSMFSKVSIYSERSSMCSKVIIYSERSSMFSKVSIL